MEGERIGNGGTWRCGKWPMISPSLALFTKQAGSPQQCVATCTCMCVGNHSISIHSHILVDNLVCAPANPLLSVSPPPHSHISISKTNKGRKYMYVNDSDSINTIILIENNLQSSAVNCFYHEQDCQLHVHKMTCFRCVALPMLVTDATRVGN